MQLLKPILRPRFVWLLIVAVMALTFNNWLLAPWLSPELFKAHAEVSEFSINGEPFAAIFRLFDIISGLIFILCGLVLYKYSAKLGRLLKYTAISMAVFGASNIFDAAFPLPCSETIDRACDLGVKTSLHSFHIPAHGISSTLIGAAYLIFPLFGLLYCYRYRLKAYWLITVSSVAVIMAVVAVIKVLHTAVYTGTVPTAGGGIYQEFQMSIFCLWFVVGFLSLPRTNRLQ